MAGGKRGLSIPAIIDNTTRALLGSLMKIRTDFWIKKNNNNHAGRMLSRVDTSMHGPGTLQNCSGVQVKVW